MNDVLKKLEKTIEKDETIILANSGGPDSMCLLKILLSIRETKNINIICAHVNHSVREESDLEEKELKKICDFYKVGFESINLNGKIVGNFHNESRKLRYDFFNKVLKKYNSNKLLTAHHGDDLIETILIRLIRGSSLESLSGFAFSRKFDGSLLLRPLINKEKKEILNYCEENNVKYFIDKSNYKDDYFRNRIRNNVIPILKEENEQLLSNFSDFSKNLSGAYDYIYDASKLEYKSVVVNNKININKLFDLHYAIKREILRMYFLDVYGEDKIETINKKHFTELEKIMLSERPNVIATFPCNKVVVKEYNDIYIKEKEDSKPFNKMLLEEYVKVNGQLISLVEEEPLNNNDYLMINEDDVKLPLYVKSREKGDFVEISGGGSKKVKNILIDKKVPITKREQIILVTDSRNKILWIPGVYKSKYALKKSDNYDIILKYVKNNRR